MLPTRPNATAVPTPVLRISVGYTCAASAYMVVCTALSRPPVTSSIARSVKVLLGSRSNPASTMENTIAAADMPSIVALEPMR